MEGVVLLYPVQVKLPLGLSSDQGTIPILGKVFMTNVAHTNVTKIRSITQVSIKSLKGLRLREG